MARKDTPAERIILLTAGESGSGKSFFVACLRNALIFDTDIGGGLAAYDRRIAGNGSERVEVGSYLDIIDELAKRRQHLQGITTLAIDHLSTLQQEAVIRHNPQFQENTFGREHDRANKEWRKIRDLVRWGDFNLVCTAHLKAQYANKQQVGMTADASKNIAGDFHVYLQLHGTASGGPAQAKVVKWRRDPEDARGPVPQSFRYTVEEFTRINGAGFNHQRQQVAMASTEQVAEVERLLAIVKLPDGVVEKWLSKAKADSFAEFTADAIAKCIAHMNSLIKGEKHE